MRSAGVHSQRQWPGVRVKDDSGVAEAIADPDALHCSGQSVGERVCGELPLEAARRVLESGNVREYVFSQAADAGMEGRLQT